VRIVGDSRQHTVKRPEGELRSFAVRVSTRLADREQTHRRPVAIDAVVDFAEPERGDPDPSEEVDLGLLVRPARRGELERFVQ